jgi:hypothetical protein
VECMAHSCSAEGCKIPISEASRASRMDLSTLESFLGVSGFFFFFRLLFFA